MNNFFNNKATKERIRMILCSFVALLFNFSVHAQPLIFLQRPAEVVAAPSGSWIDIETQPNGNANNSFNSIVQYGDDLSLPSGTATKARLYISTFTSTTHIKIALYSGGPTGGSLIAQGVGTITGTGYVEVTFNSPANVSAGTHTVWWTPDGSGAEFRVNTSSSTFNFNVGTSYQDPPTTSNLGSAATGKVVCGVFVQ